jgi:hypothetical protein
MGGNKTSDIDKVPLLTWYRDEFKRLTRQPGTRLMIVGYGFQDLHINTMLHAAAGSGTKIFIVDPRGVDILENAPSPDGLREGMQLALPAPAAVTELYRTVAPIPDLKPGSYDLNLTRVTFPAGCRRIRHTTAQEQLCTMSSPVPGLTPSRERQRQGSRVP